MRLTINDKVQLLRALNNADQNVQGMHTLLKYWQTPKAQNTSWSQNYSTEGQPKGQNSCQDSSSRLYINQINKAKSLMHKPEWQETLLQMGGVENTQQLALKIDNLGNEGHKWMMMLIANVMTLNDYKQSPEELWKWVQKISLDCPHDITKEHCTNRA
jgi:hypothetical protein